MEASKTSEDVGRHKESVQLGGPIGNRYALSVGFFLDADIRNAGLSADVMNYPIEQDTSSLVCSDDVKWPRPIQRWSRGDVELLSRLGSEFHTRFLGNLRNKLLTPLEDKVGKIGEVCACLRRRGPPWPAAGRAIRRPCESNLSLALLLLWVACTRETSGSQFKDDVERSVRSCCTSL